MKYIALFGLLGGVVVAVGQMTAAQWAAIGQTLLALILAYGLTVLPWLLALLFLWLWWRQRQITLLWRVSYNDQTTYYAARQAAARTQQRKRVRR